MTLYKIPDEPKFDRVWTEDQTTGSPIEWVRFENDRIRARHWRRADGKGPEVSWDDLLQVGPVDDEDPDFRGFPPPPWAYAGGIGPIDATGEEIVVDEIPFAALIRVVNEWHANRSGS